MCLSKEVNEIKKLREEGNGYKAISTKLNITREKVRYHCKKLGLTGTKGKISVKKQRFCSRCEKPLNNIGYNKICTDCKTKKNQLKKERTCKVCGNVFYGDQRVTCSDECLKEIRRKDKKEKFNKICEYCSNEFKTTRKETKYCSLKCSNKSHKKTHKDFVLEIIDVHEGNIVPLEEYRGADYNLKCLCIKCGNQMNKVARFYKKHGCKYCNKGSKSLGENKIALWLDDHGVRYARQYTLNDLKFKNKLLFDFALLGVDDQPVMFIEYDGEQHFKPIEHFGGEDKLSLTIKKDEIKNKYADENDIPLLRISYKDKGMIESMLTKELGL